MKSAIDSVVLPEISRPLIVLVIGQGITALLALVYGKLTAEYISPAEWGDYSLLVAAMTLLHGFLITPTIQSFKAALGRFSHQQVIQFYSRILLIIYLTVVPMGALLAGLYYKSPVFGLIWVAAFGQGVYQFGNDYLNASGQHQRYVLIQLGYALSNVLIFAVLIVCFDHRTAAGLWQSIALLNSLFASFACWQLFRAKGVDEFLAETTTDWTELIKTYKQYVGPLLSLGFWSWLINYADRYLIQIYLTDADVGQYVMGYSLGSKLLILVAPLLAFLSPRILKLRATGQSPRRANTLLLRYLICYAVLSGLGCLLFYSGRDWVGTLLLSDCYKPAFLIAPIVAIGYLFLTSIHLLEVKWYAFGQTRYVLWHNVLGAFLNVAFNLVLVPQLGILGAALAALLGFAGQFLLVILLFLEPKFNRT